MKTYAEFTVDGKEQCGSDAWYQLDGRNSLINQLMDTARRIEQLKNIHPDYNGYRIRRGEKPSTSKIIFDSNNYNIKDGSWYRYYDAYIKCDINERYLDRNDSVINDMLT